MTSEEILQDIKSNPGKHIHTFEELQVCCTINGILDLSLIDAHSLYVDLGTNGGVKCDVITGPCACGAWH